MMATMMAIVISSHGVISVDSSIDITVIPTVVMVALMNPGEL